MTNLLSNHWKSMTVWFDNIYNNTSNTSRLCMHAAAAVGILAVLYLEMKKQSNYISDL